MGKETKEGIPIATILTTAIPPKISEHFNRKLLSVPYPMDDSKKIRVLIDFLIYKVNQPKYKKFPHTIAQYNHKIKLLEILYETAKAQEEANYKNQKASRARAPFYRFLSYGSHFEKIYQRFKRRMERSVKDRKIRSI